MELKLRIPKNWEQGIYGYVVWDKETRKAVKVFKRQDHLSHAECQAVFNNELQALQIANQSEAIKHLVPKLYGQCSIGKILNEANEDISHKFFLDLNFEMEYIPGDFVKIGSLGNATLFKMVRAFSPYNINNVYDASVVLNAEGEILKLIDFSLEAMEPRHHEF